MTRYFVSYAHPTGFARCYVDLDAPVSGMDAIEAMEEAIKRNNGMRSVSILYWCRFEEPESLTLAEPRPLA